MRSTITIGFSIGILIATFISAVLDTETVAQVPHSHSADAELKASFRGAPEHILDNPLAGRPRQYPHPTFEHFVEEVATAARAEAEARIAIQQTPKDAKAYLKLADALSVLDRNQDARAAYRKALQLDPSRIETYLAFETFLEEHNRSSEIINLYEEMVVALPESEVAYARLADSLTHPFLDVENKAERAEAAYRKAISLNPERTDFYIGLGEYLYSAEFRTLFRGGQLNTEQIDKAKVVLREAVKRDPKSLVAYNLLGLSVGLGEGIAASEAIYREAIEQQPNNVETYELFGNYLYVWAMNPQGVISLYEEAIERNVTSELLYIGLGSALVRLRQYNVAEMAYREALPLSEDGLIYEKMAYFFEDTEQPEKAIPVLEQGIQRFPNKTFLYTMLGDRLQQTGRSDEAIAVYRAALPLEESTGSVRGLAEVLVKQQRYAEAVEVYEQFALTLSYDLKRIDSEYVRTWQSALQELGRTEEANNLRDNLTRDYAAYRELIHQETTALSPKTSSFYYELGQALDAQDKAAKAATAYQSALALDYDPLRTNFYLGKALFDSGQLRLAEEAFKRAISLAHPGARIDTDERYGLFISTADLYMATDRLGLAIDFYQRAVETRPYNSEELREKVAELQEVANEQ